MSVEEWWGQTFGAGGSVTLLNLTDDRLETIRKLPTKELAELIRSEENRSVRGVLSQVELRRREFGPPVPLLRCPSWRSSFLLLPW